MALSATKTWTEGEVLTAAHLTAEFAAIYTDNGQTLGNPAVNAQKMNAQSLILDANDDTLMKASTDDVVEFVIEAKTIFKIDGSVASPVNGMQLVGKPTDTGPSLDAVGDDTNLDLNLIPKGTGVIAIEGALFATHTDAVLANQVFGS